MSFTVRWGRVGRREFAEFGVAKRHCDALRALGVAAWVVDASGVELTVRCKPWSTPRDHYVLARAIKQRGCS